MAVSFQAEEGTREGAPAGGDLVLYDFDGTLARTLPAIVESYRHAFEAVLGIEFPATPEDMERVRTVRFTDLCAELAGERAALVVESFRGRYLGGLDTPVSLYPGALEAVEELASREVAVGIVTNKTRVALEADLERTGLASYPLVAIVCADDSVERKPHPRPLLLGLECSGLAPARGFYVGDGPHDMAAAAAAGMAGIGALWGDFPAAALRASRPWALAAEPSAVPSLIASETLRPLTQTG